MSRIVDFPYNDGTLKFSEPLVGIWNATSNHTTSLSALDAHTAQINHTLDGTTYFAVLALSNSAGPGLNLTRSDTSSHRYTLRPSSGESTLSFTLTYTPDKIATKDLPSSASAIQSASSTWWRNYWHSGGFVDMVSESTDARADELQRRVILATYLLAVNEAGKNPPQESGLFNNGW